MHHETRGIKKLFGFIITLMPLLMIPTILSGMEVNKKQEKNSESQGEYVLNVKGEQISLKAKDASLKAILEEIGLRMKIEVIANIPREEKITIDLDMIYLEDALKRFKINYAYIAKTNKKKGKITKIVLVPKKGGKMLSNKFEYNPQPPIQDFERETQPSNVESEYDPQPSIQMFVHEPQPPIVRSEHESQSSSTTTENDTQPSNVGSDYDPQPSIIE